MPISDDTQKMMRLLSQVILADGHIFQSEVDAMVASVRDLGLTDDIGVPLSVPKIREWFNAYMIELSETWLREPKDVTIMKLILSLSHWPDKQPIVDVLTKVSVADAEFHREEKLLISIVKAYWQVEETPVSRSVVG